MSWGLVMVKRTLRWGGLACALALIAGCGGGGGNNDQGIVFRATGVYRTQTNITPDNITCTEPPTVESAISDTGGTVSLSGSRWFPDRGDPEGNPCGGELGLQNSLQNQSINVQFVTIEYEVPGAAVQVPTYTFNTGITVPPPTCQNCTSSGQPGVVYLALRQQIVPEEIIVFLNQNVNRLPVTPYQMNVFITAYGQSDQGTNYESNTVGYTITVTD
jgi:hypothetical protein